MYDKYVRKMVEIKKKSAFETIKYSQSVGSVPIGQHSPQIVLQWYIQRERLFACSINKPAVSFRKLCYVPLKLLFRFNQTDFFTPRLMNFTEQKALLRLQFSTRALAKKAYVHWIAIRVVDFGGPGWKTAIVSPD